MLYLWNVSNISWRIYKCRGSLFKDTKTGEIWSSMKDVESGMGVTRISDLALKEIYGTCETKNHTNTNWQKEKFMKSLAM